MLIHNYLLVFMLMCLAACSHISPTSPAKQSVASQLNQQGIIYRKQGKFIAAEQAYQQAIAEQADYADAWLNLGILYDLYLPNTQKALEAYQKFQNLQMQPDKDVALWIKALESRPIENQSIEKTPEQVAP